MLSKFYYSGEHIFSNYSLQASGFHEPMTSLWVRFPSSSINAVE